MKNFLLLAAAMFAITASAQRTWDFTQIPTQQVDGTGNLTGNDATMANNGYIAAPDPSNNKTWCQFQNPGTVTEGSELTVKEGEPLEMTKDITFGEFTQEKTILFRNYPASDGGPHLYVFHTLTMYIPAKKGEMVTFNCAATKTRYIRCETATDTMLVVPQSAKGTETGDVSFILTDDDPAFEFYDRNPNGSGYRDVNMYIRSITVGPAPEETKTWDFTVTPTQQVDGTGNLTGNDPTMANNGYLPSADQYGTFQNPGKIDEGAELTVKAGEPLEMTKGITFGETTQEKSILVRNYPAASDGCHLFIWHTLTMYIPAKKGQQVTFNCAANKKRYIRCETATDTMLVVPCKEDGESFGNVSFVLTDDNPVFEFYEKNPNGSGYRDVNMSIRSITVGPVSTGIQEVKAEKKNVADNRMYNLMGQRISEPVKGQVYIMNGRKYLAK